MTTRSDLTTIVNRIQTIRFQHNQGFAQDIRDGVPSDKAVTLRRYCEDADLAEALADTGWTWESLTEEIARRTTDRWARYLRYGWF